MVEILSFVEFLANSCKKDKKSENRKEERGEMGSVIWDVGSGMCDV
jgi:hypothetical protein